MRAKAGVCTAGLLAEIFQQLLFAFMAGPKKVSRNTAHLLAQHHRESRSGGDEFLFDFTD